MELRIKNYIENCMDIAKISVKLHKKFVALDLGNFWLADAEKYANLAGVALEHNRLPSDPKKKLIKVEVIE